MKIKSKMKLSPRTRVRLKQEEIGFVRDYIKTEPTAFSIIKMNTGIASTTIHGLLKNGWVELHVATRLRDFIKAAKELA